MPRKCLEKIGNAWFVYEKLQAISTIYKLFGYNFWFNFLELGDKISLTIQMRIFNDVVYNIKYNIKYRGAICLNFGYRFLTTVTILRLDFKSLICKFLAFVIAVMT